MLAMLNATLTKRLDLTSELMIFQILPDKGVPDFLPGQYVALGTNGPTQEQKLVKRAYSIGSSPLEKGYLEFYFSIVTDGQLTPRLDLLHVGDRLFVSPKITGTFTLCRVPAGVNLIFVATGTGIAPFLSMLRTPATWQIARSISLLHGVRRASDLAYRSELEGFASSNPAFTYLPTVSRDDSSWGGHRGRVQHLFQGGLVTLNPCTDHVFLCGNPAMIDELEEVLIQRGMQLHANKKPGNLHLERYW